jgi:hypothetical protein
VKTGLCSSYDFIDLACRNVPAFICDEQLRSFAALLAHHLYEALRWLKMLRRLPVARAGIDRN